MGNGFMFRSKLAEVVVAAPAGSWVTPWRYPSKTRTGFVDGFAGRDAASERSPRGALTRRGFLAALAGGAAALRARRARAQAEVPAFEVRSRDIARIHDLGGRLHIALNGSARARFAAFTAGNLGRLARVTAGGVVLIEAVVRAEIGSGLFSSAALDDHTRSRVLRLLIGG